MPSYCGMAYLYSRPERLADGIIHILGIGAAIIAGTLLIMRAALHMPETIGSLGVAAVSIYAGAALCAFVASALYHMTPWDRARPWFHRIDHATIYFKIAGTYTPLIVLIGSVYAYLVLALVWAVAAIGAVGKMKQWLRPGLGSTVLYLVMGWASVTLIWPLAQTVPVLSLTLIISGGVLYSVGAIFNHCENLRFSTAIWHSFVLVGSGCFFAAIALALNAAGA